MSETCSAFFSLISALVKELQLLSYTLSLRTIPLKSLDIYTSQLLCLTLHRPNPSFSFIWGRAQALEFSPFLYYRIRKRTLLGFLLASARKHLPVSRCPVDVFFGFPHAGQILINSVPPFPPCCLSRLFFRETLQRSPSLTFPRQVVSFSTPGSLQGRPISAWKMFLITQFLFSYS